MRCSATHAAAGTVLDEFAACLQMVDVGCGIGGSSRHISRMFGCTSQGITLSPVQAARANELSAAAGLGDKCKFQVTFTVLAVGRTHL